MSYQLIKLIHILSATLMIGTGFGSAFYLFFTYKTCKPSTVKDVLRFVILTDNIFTTPSVIVQLITGLILSDMLNITETKWFFLVLSIGFIVLILWIRAVFLQIKMKKILDTESKFTDEFHKQMKYWFYLGIPSFAASIYLYYLMVYKDFL